VSVAVVVQSYAPVSSRLPPSEGHAFFNGEKAPPSLDAGVVIAVGKIIVEEH